MNALEVFGFCCCWLISSTLTLWPKVLRLWGTSMFHPDNSVVLWPLSVSSLIYLQRLAKTLLSALDPRGSLVSVWPFAACWHKHLASFNLLMTQTEGAACELVVFCFSHMLNHWMWGRGGVEGYTGSIRAAWMWLWNRFSQMTFERLTLNCCLWIFFLPTLISV